MSQNFGPNVGSGQYYPTAIAGNLYAGANQAVVPTALNAGLGATVAGGLTLANPITSTANLVIQAVNASFATAQTNAAVISVAAGYAPLTALTGTLTVVPSQNANPASANTAQGKLYSSASVVLPAAPAIVQVLGSVDTGAVTTQVGGLNISAELQGSLILPPGGYLTFVSSAAGTASSFMGSISWAEQSSDATQG